MQTALMKALPFDYYRAPALPAPQPAKIKKTPAAKAPVKKTSSVRKKVPLKPRRTAWDHLVGDEVN